MIKRQQDYGHTTRIHIGRNGPQSRDEAAVALGLVLEEGGGEGAVHRFDKLSGIHAARKFCNRRLACYRNRRFVGDLGTSGSPPRANKYCRPRANSVRIAWLYRTMLSDFVTALEIGYRD